MAWFASNVILALPFPVFLVSTFGLALFEIWLFWNPRRWQPIVLSADRHGDYARGPEDQLYLIGGADRAIQLRLFPWEPAVRTWPAEQLEEARAFAAQASAITGVPVVEWLHPDRSVRCGLYAHDVAWRVRADRLREQPWLADVVPRRPRRLVTTTSGLEVRFDMSWLRLDRHTVTGSPGFRPARRRETLQLSEVVDAQLVVHSAGLEDRCAVWISHTGGLMPFCSCVVSRIERSPERVQVLGELEWVAATIRRAAAAEGDPAKDRAPEALLELRRAGDRQSA